MLGIETFREPGTYVLILRLEQPAALEVGRLGILIFPAGSHAYVGSARGKGGLAARLKHHLGETRRPYWHIDYLKTRARIVEIWAAEHGQRQECTWADALLRMAEATLPAPGFGASDCRCQSHLFHFPGPPRLADFNRCLEKLANHGPARCIFTALGTKQGGID